MKVSFAERQAQWKREIALIVEFYLKWHGRAINLSRPKRYTEKIQWRKLYDLNPFFPIFCDKWAVRDYIAQYIGEKALVPVLWRGADPQMIPFSELKRPYVIKTSHASGQVIIVTKDNHKEWPQTRIRRQLTEWLSRPYGLDTLEKGYFDVPRQILIEKLIIGPDNQTPMERRCFVFHGKVRVINTVLVEAGKVRNGAFHTPEWERLYWYFKRPPLERNFLQPPKLRQMLKMAERLAQNHDHLRVDFFDTGNKIYVGEITVYPWSGMDAFHPDEADTIMGRWWHLRWPRFRAWKAKCFPQIE